MKEKRFKRRRKREKEKETCKKRDKTREEKRKERTRERKREEKREKKREKRKHPCVYVQNASVCTVRTSPCVQWHARFAGFAGDVTTRAVFPSVVARPQMTFREFGALIVDSDSGMCQS